MKHFVIGRGKLGQTVFNSLGKIGYPLANSVEEADFVWITVPDSAIEAVVRENEIRIKPSSVLIHCSGVLPASVMKNKKTDNLVSLHPAYSFSSPMDFFPEEIFWTFQGNKSLFGYFEELVKKWKGKVVEITEAQKPLYHSACVFASNFPVVSLLIAEKLFNDCGVDYREVFKGLVAPLCLKLSENPRPESLLTGPAVRGDTETVLREIEVLREKNRDISEIYRFLSEFVLQNM